MKTDQFEFNKLAIFNALREAGIDSAKITYEGGGDEGAVTEIEHMAFGQPYEMKSPIMVTVKKNHSTWDSVAKSSLIQQVEEQQEIDQAFEDFLWDCMAIHGHLGWENGDGARGTLVLDASNMTCTLEHTRYIIELADSSHEF